MSRRVRVFVAVLFASSIGAAAAAPRVIAGIGEREAGRLFPAREPVVAAPAPTPGYVSPRPAPRAEQPAAPGAYGGGFIELLVTGRTPEPGPRPRLAALGAPETNVRRQIDSVFLRAEVDYHGSERPGTIVIDSENKFLYLVQAGGRALRYGIGVGRPGFVWSGV